MKNNGILAVGSVALDTVSTPFGKAVRALGGSATFFSASRWISARNCVRSAILYVKAAVKPFCLLEVPS